MSDIVPLLLEWFRHDPVKTSAGLVLAGGAVWSLACLAHAVLGDSEGGLLDLLDLGGDGGDCGDGGD